MSDDVSITTTGGRRVSGWMAVQIQAGLDSFPRYFSVSLTERFPGELREVVFQAGDACVVRIGGDPVITGYIDRYEPTIAASQHTIRVTGRGKCADLVDCSAVWPGNEINHNTAFGIAEKLCRPYNITVTAGPEVDVFIPTIVFVITETPYSIIERVCRYRALLAYELADGSLRLQQVGTEAMASGFAQGVNVEQAAAIYGMDQRFSEYRVFRQSTDQLGDIPSLDSGESPAGNLMLEIRDAGVPRFRMHAVVAENADQSLGAQRALWERSRRIGRSQAIRVTCDNWRDSAGRLWEPNRLAHVAIPILKTADKMWLISEVGFRRDQNGRHADVTLMPPQAFSIEPPPPLGEADSPVYHPVPRAD